MGVFLNLTLCWSMLVGLVLRFQNKFFNGVLFYIRALSSRFTLVDFFLFTLFEIFIKFKQDCMIVLQALGFVA